MSGSASQSSVDWPKVRSSASAALKIAGIAELWSNTFAPCTVETGIGALMLIGLRYLGYIGSLSWYMILPIVFTKIRKIQK